jgi:thymidylate synthase
MSIPTDADHCVFQTITDAMNGEYVVSGKDCSYEVLHYQTGMSNPQARIMMHPARPLNIVVAVARFTWLIAGSNRVEDIAFYEPKVRRFSDDGLAVPGSCYGARIFGAPTGYCNQIKGVIERLRIQPASRQAATVVWLPEDAVRESQDIPCTFGMFFHVRDGKLTMSTIMRSNNAFRILPFNLFEFTLLQEIVACELEVPLGDYVHWAASMHVYDNEKETPPTEAIANTGPAMSYLMMPMPYGNALEQATDLARFEARMRHSCYAEELGDIATEAAEELETYWLNLFEVLLAYNAAKRGWEYGPLHQTVLVELAQEVIRKEFGDLALRR